MKACRFPSSAYKTLHKNAYDDVPEAMALAEELLPAWDVMEALAEETLAEEALAEEALVEEALAKDELAEEELAEEELIDVADASLDPEQAAACGRSTLALMMKAVRYMNRRKLSHSSRASRRHTFCICQSLA